MESAYVRISGVFRALILNGTLPAGTRLPSRYEIAEREGVSDKTAKRAIDQLMREGLVESRSGVGSFVRERPVRRRLIRGLVSQVGTGSPFAASQRAIGSEGTWESRSRTVCADEDIAERLMIGVGDRVMRTRYVFRADADPVMLSTSHEPLEITACPGRGGGVPVIFPEEGPYGGLGVVDRMRVIGQDPRLASEIARTRPATPEEVERLGGISGGWVLHILRTYVDGDDRPLEIADIVLPGDRAEIEFRYPVSGPPVTAS